MYRPPSTSPYEFNDNLRDYLNINCCTKNGYNILIGDINIDLLQARKAVYVGDYINLLSEYGFISMINDYTRIQKQSKTCIDHIFIKSTEDINEISIPLILKTDISDHYSTIVQVILGKQKITIGKENKYKKYLDYNKLDNQLRTTSWDTVYAAENVESATNELINIVTTKIKNCTKLIYIKRSRRKRKECVTEALINSINKKNDMYVKLQADTENIVLRNEYITYKKQLSILINKTKSDFYRSKIENEKDTEKLWNMINDMTKNNNKTANISSVKNLNGDSVQGITEIVNIFNKTYTGMGRN